MLKNERNNLLYLLTKRCILTYICMSTGVAHNNGQRLTEKRAKVKQPPSPFDCLMCHKDQAWFKRQEPTFSFTFCYSLTQSRKHVSHPSRITHPPLNIGSWSSNSSAPHSQTFSHPQKSAAIHQNLLQHSRTFLHDHGISKGRRRHRILHQQQYAAGGN